MSKKTVKVKEIKDDLNVWLANKDWYTPEQRKAIAQVLEHILHMTGNYRGFNYVQWANEGGFEQWLKDGEPKDNSPYLGDETRRVYY